MGLRREVSIRSIFVTLVLGLALATGLGGRSHASDLDLPIGGGTVEDEALPPDKPDEEDPPKFYDEEIPADSQSVIFVVDRSSSMTLPVKPFTGLDGQVVTNGSRLDMVKCELTRSISSLPKDFTFNIVIYSECVEAWKPARVQAIPEVKVEAIQWVNQITPWGWTNTGGATSRALADHDNKVVMLLSDGAPNFLDCAQTYLGDFEVHRNVIKSANSQKAVVHTFGIGLDPETRAFMMEVARDNGGSFRELD